MLRGRTRVLNACQRCRRLKIKCSGTPPCRTCLARGLTCDFGAEEKQLKISEKELFELKARVRYLERHSRVETTNAPAETPKQWPLDAAFASNVENGSTGTLDCGQLVRQGYASADLAAHHAPTPRPSGEIRGRNPLVPERPSYVTEDSGRIRWLGHSSTYAFTQRVLHIVQQSPPSNPAPEILLSSDGHTYRAETDLLTTQSLPDLSNLPSKDTAAHYLDCVKFRTNPLLYLFDDETFRPALQQFYRDPLNYAMSDMIWYTHFLVLLAMGKSLDRGKRHSDGTGSQISEYFMRALKVIPDMTFLCGQHMKSTELLCSIALYLQSVDHRSAALIYISQAVRMAQLYALNLDLEEIVLGTHEVMRGRRLWWTVYTLDKKLTLNQGIANIVNDDDIRSPWPLVSDTDDDITALAINISICRLLGKLMSLVYSYSNEEQKSLIAITQEVLSGAAHVKEELRTYTERCFGQISRVLGHLELGYHHCIILACRPALYTLLQLRSDAKEKSLSTALSSSMTGLVQACVDSAVQTVQTLSQLKDFELIDTFFPFDLECAFSAAFVLIIANYIHNRAAPKDNSMDSAKSIIEYIADRGSIQAGLRKLEVEQLAEQLAEQLRNASGPSNMPKAPIAPSTSADLGEVRPPRMEARGNMHDPMFGSPFFDEWNFDTGLSADQILNLADALEGEFVYYQ